MVYRLNLLSIVLVIKGSEIREMYCFYSRCPDFSEVKSDQARQSSYFLCTVASYKAICSFQHILLRKIKWVGDVACSREIKNAYNILTRRRDPTIDGKITFKKLNFTMCIVLFHCSLKFI
jgi:hypothetical protein